MCLECDFPTPERPSGAGGSSVEAVYLMNNERVRLFLINRALKGAMGTAEARKTEASTLITLPYQ